MSLRKRYLLTLLVPLALVYVILLAAEGYFLVHSTLESTQEDILKVAGQYADRFDGYFRQASQSADITAQFFSHDSDPTEEEIYSLLNAQVSDTPFIYGAALAVVPGGYRGRKLFAPYVYRKGQALLSMDIGKDGYDYTDGSWSWWSVPQMTEKPAWTEPYLDKGAGNVVMSTYSAPIFRGGKFWGVATVDVELTGLRKAVASIMPEHVRFIMVTPSGQLVYHADEKWLGRSVFELIKDEKRPDSEVRKIVDRLKAGESGVVILPRGDKKQIVSYTPVQSTGWGFIAGLDEDVALESVRRHLYRLLFEALGVLLVITFVTVLATGRLVEPIEALRRATERMAQGDRDLTLPVNSRDELGALARSFELMADRVEERENCIRQLESARFQTLVKNIPGVTFRYADDLNKTMDFVSKPIEELTGYPPESFIGDSELDYHDIVLPEDVEAREQSIREAVKTGQPWEIEYRIRRKDGSQRWVYECGRAIKEEDGKVWLDGIMLDHTSRKEMEDELLTAREDADAANTAKSVFLANMSHEIRTPMNAVIGLSHLALQTELSSRQRDYLTKIQGAANNLLGIINDILDFSKIEAGKLEIEEIDFRVDQVLENVSSILAPKSSEKGLELLITRDSDIPPVLVGDPLRLGQILINLAGNAIKFTEKGEVMIRVDSEGEERLRFTIKDTGIGMTEEQVGRLFQSFSQADTSTTRRYGGTGLGLAICKRLVEMMGGEIQVESEPGRGSTFSFTVAVKPSANEFTRSFQPGPELRGMRVLLVDDNATARQVLEELMEAFSFRCHSVSSGKEALQELESAAEDDPYSLVLMDWRMPGMDGLETSRLIRESKVCSPRIIMVTSYGREEVRMQADKAGLDGFLMKPVTPSLLFDSIMSATGTLSHGEPAKAEVAKVPRFGGARVLVAEDNEINQQVARELLTQVELDVTVVSNGREALQAVESGEFQLILMDVDMPVMDGIAATKELRANGCELPILAMTAHAMAEAKERTLEAGMNAHITKPINPKRLYQTLQLFLESTPGELVREEGSNSEVLLQGLEVEQGLERVGGNESLYFKLLRDFCRDYSAVVSELESADAQEARGLAHTVRGVSANLGIVDVSAAAARVEDAARGGQDFRAHLPALQDSLDAIIPQIQFLPASSDEAKREQLSQEQVCETLTRCVQMAQEGSIMVEEELLTLEPDLRARGLAEIYSQAMRCVENFEFDQAGKLLQELLSEVNNGQ